jgi:hypothetical protein
MGKVKVKVTGKPETRIFPGVTESATAFERSSWDFISGSLILPSPLAFSFCQFAILPLLPPHR